MRPLNLLIMDKDPVTNSALEVLLKDDERLRIAGNARNEQEAFQVLSERAVDVVLMDINVNNKTYYRPLQRMKRRFPEQKVLALLYEEPEVIEGILNSNAEGYFLKERDIGELPEALIKVHEEGSFRPMALKAEIPDPEGVLSLKRKREGI